MARKFPSLFTRGIRRIAFALARAKRKPTGRTNERAGREPLVFAVELAGLASARYVLVAVVFEQRGIGSSLKTRISPNELSS